MTAAVERFSVAAAAFCALVEREEFAACEVLGALLDVFSFGLQLPNMQDLEFEEDIDWSDPVGLDAAARRVEENVRRCLGGSDLRELAEDPSEEGELVFAFLDDDIADIYRDLRKAPLANAHPEAEGVWKQRLLLEAHWGNHATAAIRILWKFVAEDREIAFEKWVDEND